MSEKRRRFTAAFRAAVALEALRGQRTIQEIAQDNGVHPNQVTAWKKQAQEGLVGVMEDGRLSRGRDSDALVESLYEQIGRQKMEIDWLKKSSALPIEARRGLVEPEAEVIALARQCELLGLARSTFYYRAAPESPLNLRPMRLIDEEYLRHPFYGAPRMTRWLRKDQGFTVNHKRIERLMRLMGIAIVSYS